jgi:hypothetical protein
MLSGLDETVDPAWANASLPHGLPSRQSRSLALIAVEKRWIRRYRIIAP